MLFPRLFISSSAPFSWYFLEKSNFAILLAISFNSSIGSVNLLAINIVTIPEIITVAPPIKYKNVFEILTNYLTNAIKNSDEIEKEKYIEIKIEEKESTVRISVFNTGKNISEENLNKIWKRFYKEDSSRNREAGGSGIGLSLVKAIMDNYKNEYGVINKYNGVEFYFELNKI